MDTPTPLPGFIAARWNQNASSFAIATETGFLIVGVDPVRVLYHFRGKGFAVVEQLFLSNILALVGGGKSPHFTKNKVVIWDQHQEKALAELCFNSEVKNVRLRKDRIFVVLEEKVIVYDFATLKRLDTISTRPNPTGIIAVSQQDTHIVIACPAESDRVGQVLVKSYTWGQTVHIPKNHTHAISAIALGFDRGMLLVATTSESGRHIHISSVNKNQTVVSFKNYKRGQQIQTICSLAFSLDGNELCCSSLSGTIHQWSLAKPDETGEQVKCEAETNCAFSQKGTLCVLGLSTGSLYQYQLTPNSGVSPDPYNWAYLLSSELH